LVVWVYYATERASLHAIAKAVAAFWGTEYNEHSRIPAKEK
jgi:hypothetical protein